MTDPFSDIPLSQRHVNIYLMLSNMIIRQAKIDGDDRWHRHLVEQVHLLNDMRAKYIKRFYTLTGRVAPHPLVVGMRAAQLGASAPGPSSPVTIGVPDDMMFVTGTELKINETDQLYPDATYEMEAHCRCRNCTKEFMQVGWPVILQCPNCEVSGIFVETAYLHRKE